MTEEAKTLTDSATTSETNKPTRKRSGKKKRNISHGQAHILATFNNTLVTITDQNGNVLTSASSGRAGFKGPKKSTPYAAGIVVRTAVEKAKEFGLRDINVFIKGVGSGREAAVRALYANGLNVLSIKDVTPVPHNGCRPPRPRRV